MTDVFEMRGNIANSIVVDGDLRFPNVQTCVAVVAVHGGAMAGAHVTLADRNRLAAVGQALRAALGGDGMLYAVGPIDAYDLGAMGDVRTFATPLFLEVRATINGAVEFFVRPIDGDAWQRLDVTLFN